MYDTSEEALEDRSLIHIGAAGRELARHGCRILESRLGQIQVTNDIDDPEWIDCTPSAILIWLGY